jgi:hypothetical protein
MLLSLQAPVQEPIPPVQEEPIPSEEEPIPSEEEPIPSEEEPITSEDDDPITSEDDDPITSEDEQHGPTQGLEVHTTYVFMPAERVTVYDHSNKEQGLVARKVVSAGLGSGG